jgi:hypothetical protein
VGSFGLNGDVAVISADSVWKSIDALNNTFMGAMDEQG